MTHIDHKKLERMGPIDLTASQRFAARDHVSALRLRTRQRHNAPTFASLASHFEVDQPFQVLGGLEVKFTTGSSVQITPGEMIVVNPNPITEARPATYSPPPVEPDDDDHAVADLAATTTVAPSTPIASATDDDEWWIVTVTPALEAVEQVATGRLQFNPDTGTFDPVVVDKIMRWTLTPAVIRGAAGATIADVLATMPAGSTCVAWIWVPATSTNLSNALFFDVRQLATTAAGPNMIGGRGSLGASNITPNFTSPPSTRSSDSETFSGSFWARINGQSLHCVIPDGAGTSSRALASPNSNWNTDASLTNPGLAWLYIADVGGYVPRLYAKGSSAIGNGAATDETTAFRGALVLSSEPPQSGLPIGASVRTGGLFDLRPQSQIALPKTVIGGVTYDFRGMFARNALCLGPVIYTAVDVVNHAPVIAGGGMLEPSGWLSWSLGDGPMSFPSSLLFDDFTREFAPGGDRRRINVSVTPKALPLGAVPILGVRFSLGATATTDEPKTSQLVEGKPRAGRIHFIDSCNTSPQLMTEAEILLDPSQPTGEFMGRAISDTVGSAFTFNSVEATILSIKWPYGEPLAT